MEEIIGWLKNNDVLTTSVASSLLFAISVIKIIKLDSVNEFMKLLVDVIKILKGVRKAHLEDIVFDIRTNTEVESIIQQYKYEIGNDRITRVRLILATAGKYDLDMGMCEYIQQIAEYPNTVSTMSSWNYQVPAFLDVFNVGKKLTHSKVAVLDKSEMTSPLILNLMHKHKEKQAAFTWLGSFGKEYALYTVTVFKNDVTDDDIERTHKLIYTLQNELNNIKGFERRTI